MIVWIENQTIINYKVLQITPQEQSPLYEHLTESHNFVNISCVNICLFTVLGLPNIKNQQKRSKPQRSFDFSFQPHQGFVNYAVNQFDNMDSSATFHSIFTPLRN